MSDNRRRIPPTPGKRDFKFDEDALFQRSPLLLFACLCSFWHPSQTCDCLSAGSKSALKEECQNTRLLCSLPFSSLRPPSVCYHTPKRSVSLTGVIIFTQTVAGRPSSSFILATCLFLKRVIKFSSDLERGSLLSPFPLRARVAGGPS